MATTNQIIQPYSNVPYIPLNDVGGVQRKGAQFLNNVKQMSVGFGSKVFRIDRDGMWAGAETFASAPWSVDWDGNMIANSITLSGYIPTGDALDDIGIGGIGAAYISVSSLSAISADMGSITAGTITGALIRTSSTGARVEIQGSTDRIRIYDSSDEERMRLDQESLIFYDAAGDETGRIGALYSNILAVQIPVGELGFVVYYDGDARMAVGNNGAVFYENVDMQNNNILACGDIEANDSTSDIGTSAIPFDNLFIEDVFFATQTTNPTTNGQIRYYNNGGSEGIRCQFGGSDFQFDASGV